MHEPVQHRMSTAPHARTTETKGKPVSTTTLVSEDIRSRFREDGVVHLPGLLAGEWIELLEAGHRRNMVQPGPYGKVHFADTPREFSEDRCNYFTTPEYQILLRESPLVDVVADVLGSEGLWLHHDQLFVKGAGLQKRTPWHQDSPSYSTAGWQMANTWITLDAIPAEQSLEFVKGSHRGPLYSRSEQTGTNQYTGERAPDFRADGPPIPDIDGNPEDFDIVSYAIEPGDVVLFHVSILHGGGAVASGQRRTVSYRLMGDDITYAEPLAGRCEPTFPGARTTARPGERHITSWYPQLLPRPTTPLW